jgi:hypothetical protein
LRKLILQEKGSICKTAKGEVIPGYVACCWLELTNIENIGLEEVGIATDKDKILV